MPVTFEGVSEYKRNFVVPETVISDSTHSPPGKTVVVPVQPHPHLDHVMSAGLSSAKMAVTNEPAFARKKKPVESDKKVTFTTDYAEHGSPTTEDNKAMRFRAGFRRVDVPTPTEYNLQFSWKEPSPDHAPGSAPIIVAEETLLSDKKQQLSHSHKHRHKREREARSVENGVGDGPQQANGNPQRNDVTEGQNDIIHQSHDPESPIGRRRDVKVPRLGREGGGRTREDQGDGASHIHQHGSRNKASKKKSKSHHHHHHGGSKKHKSGHSRMYTSEYKREFKVWPVSSTSGEAFGKGGKKKGKKEQAVTVAGSPQVLKDSSDPRLLKHKPLPTHAPITRWGSEYSANFLSPVDLDFEGGVWKGAPRPDLYMKPVEKSHDMKPPVDDSQGPHPVHTTTTTTSWYDQLVELRHRAEEYKTRAQSVHFPPFNLPRHQGDFEDGSSISTSSSLISHSVETSESGDRCSPSTISPMDSNSEHGGHLVGKAHKQLQGGETKQLFTRASGPTAERHGLGRAGHKESHGGHRHGGITVEDVEEGWELESTSMEESDTSTSSGRGFSTDQALVTQPPKHRADFDKMEGFRPKIIPRPNAFIGKGESIEGRVPTPELQKSVSRQQSRHHLDTTTPSGGGLLISPAKPVVGGDGGVAKSIKLPFPPTSPKYRRDMKSKAPIFPSPGTDGNGRQLTKSTEEMRPKSVPDDSSPQVVPASSSPYHAHCVPRPHPIPRSSHTHDLAPSHSTHPRSPQQSHATQQPIDVKSSTLTGPVRKLLFESHSKQEPLPKRHAHPKQSTQGPTLSQQELHSKASTFSAAKSSHSNVRSCETCGSHLRSSSILGGGTAGSLGAGHYPGVRTAPPTNLSQLHQKQQSALHASRQQSQMKLHEIRSKLASHSDDFHHRISHDVAYSDGQRQPPDSGIGSSNRGPRSDILGPYSRGGFVSRRPADVDELSLSSLSLSNCSVASDVLRKAQERRDRFWTNHSPHITAS